LIVILFEDHHNHYERSIAGIVIHATIITSFPHVVAKKVSFKSRSCSLLVMKSFLVCVL
jgi:hypothetical protein